MDEYSTRRTAGGLVVSRRGPSFLRDSSENNRDRSVQVCSRAGCSSKMNQMKDSQTGSPSKAKTLKAPFRSHHGKEIAGSSSRSPTSVNTARKPSFDSRKKLGLRLETDSESSSIKDESEESSQSTPISGENQTRFYRGKDEQESDDTNSGDTGASSSGLANKPVKRNTPRFCPGRQDSGAGSSSFSFNQITQGVKNGITTSRYNLKNLKCNSISDVVPSGNSSPESSQGKRRDTGRKRIGEPESSLSARGKKMNGPMVDDKRNDNPSRGVSISDSRRTRNITSTGDNNNSASARNRRSTARTRLSNQENRNRLPMVESPLQTPSSPQPEMSFDTTTSSSENQFHNQPSNRSSSFSRPGINNERRRPNRPFGSYDTGISRSFMNQDAVRQYNLDGIAEMLLALERIEQDEEPSYEQLLVLETNLFLGGLGFHDQHRDMRLDIDNMSYEELLALEERIGTVNTAVPEEDLAKCLKKSIYQGTVDRRENSNDFKCSICQEEYTDGDEIGRLGCDHRFHIGCVNQWLRLKNWCPICKASVAPSPLASPPP